VALNSVDFQTVGYLDLVLSFATRRSATGAAANRVEYWTASGWVTAAKFTSNATAWELVSLKLAAGDFLANGSASLRFVVDGATGSTGSIRFDNISVSGSAIPAPGAIALLGLAGVLSRRKR
jgi:MYXO-CTERM domain-containing protein